jgi:hypothetical protein
MHLNQKESALWTTHNLEVYLHLVDGYGRYDKVPTRDLVLVNKRSGFLKDDIFVPEEWWQLKHKGLQYIREERRWCQPSRALEDVPVPPKQKTVDQAKTLKENGQIAQLVPVQSVDKGSDSLPKPALPEQVLDTR